MNEKRGVGGIGFATALLIASACACSGACGSSKAAPGATGASDGGSSGGAAATSGGTSGAAATSGGTTPTGIAGPGTSTSGCRIFPNDNPWNTDISALPVDTALTTQLASKLDLSQHLHPDFGTFSDEYGIPITVGKAGTPIKIGFNTSYGPKESDKLACPGGGGDFCYPVPLDSKIEGGTKADSGEDRHVLFLDTTNAPEHCVLYELYNAQNPSSSWTCASSAIWHLDSNALRPEGWTSADAAGLPVLPGLVRKEEIDRGEIPHALRFTMNSTQNGYIHPATHASGKNDASLPPMGLRVRLKSTFADGSFTGPLKVITTAMKKYGMLLADNGSDWYVSGETNDAWDMDPLVSGFEKIKGSDFEIVTTGTIVPQPD